MPNPWDNLSEEDLRILAMDILDNPDDPRHDAVVQALSSMGGASNWLKTVREAEAEAGGDVFVPGMLPLHRTGYEPADMLDEDSNPLIWMGRNTGQVWEYIYNRQFDRELTQGADALYPWRETPMDPRYEDYKQRYDALIAPHLADTYDYTTTRNFGASDLGLPANQPWRVTPAGNLQQRGHINLKSKSGYNRGSFGHKVKRDLVDVGASLKKMVLANYDRLVVGHTSTLRRALESSEIKTDAGEGATDASKFSIQLSLADLIRPKRRNEDSAQSADYRHTRVYGPFVFQGRRAIEAGKKQRYMRFEIQGTWITTRTVRASAPRDVFELNIAQMEEISGQVASTILSGIELGDK